MPVLAVFLLRDSVPAAWRGRASHPPQILDRGAVREQQRRAGEGWRAGRDGAVTVSDPSFRRWMPLDAPSKKAAEEKGINEIHDHSKNGSRYIC